MELLTWLIQPLGWNTLRYQGISYPRIAEWGQRLRQDLGLHLGRGHYAILVLMSAWNG